MSGVCCGVYFLYQLWQAENENRIFSEAPVRGSFFDCSRRELVTTIERVSVYVRLREVVSFAKTAKALSAALGIDQGAIEQRLKKGGLRVWIAEDISEQQEKAVNALAANNSVLGVHLQKEKKRYYPHGSCGAHLFGMAEDGIGLLGLEAHYDQLVAGETQIAGQEVVAPGRPLAYGRDIVLTLNLQIQKILEEVVAEIRRQAQQGGKEIRVAAYLLASNSGAVIAGAQVPGFNPNDFAGYRNELLENMFLKPFFIPHSIRALLRDCAGFYKTDNEAILTGGWSVSAAPGVGKQLQLMASLGLDQMPAVDFSIAVDRQKKRQRGVLADDGNMPQEMAMIPQVSTPLQLLVALSSLLYNSPAKAPYLVQGFVDPATGGLQPIASSAAEEGAGAAQLDLPIRAVKRLFSAIGEKRQYGTLLEGEALGHFLQQDGGQIFVRNRIVFADIAGDKHPLALLLVTEQRQDGPQRKSIVHSRKGQAVDIAEILAKKIGRISLLHMVSIDTDGLLEQQREYGNFQGKQRFTLQQHNPTVEKQRAMEPRDMPDLRGMSLRAALRSLEGVPVRFSIEGAGVVQKQQPSPGTRVKENSLCRLVLQ